MKGGNTSFVIVWLDDTAIVKKALAGKTYYFVADAVTGKPIPKANVEFFGWQQIYYNNPPRLKSHEGLRRKHRRRRSGDFRSAAATRDSQWLITARTAEGRFAYLGFTGVWYYSPYDAEYNATKVYTITDRPVYRPAQKVKYKFWIRHAQYDMEDGSEFANQAFAVEIHNPKGEKVLTQNKTTDAYGGIEGEYASRPTPRSASIRSILPQSRRQQFPRRGVQKAGV